MMMMMILYLLQSWLWKSLALSCFVYIYTARAFFLSRSSSNMNVFSSFEICVDGISTSNPRMEFKSSKLYRTAARWWSNPSISRLLRTTIARDDECYDIACEVRSSRSPKLQHSSSFCYNMKNNGHVPPLAMLFVKWEKTCESIFCPLLKRRCRVV
jgi:hypothetical protein